MKYLLSLIAILFTFSCCTASCHNDEETNSTPNNDNDPTNLSTTKMNITIGTAVFTATLHDNPSAAAFRAMLPLTISMQELNGNEKYYDLSSALPTNSSDLVLIDRLDLT